MTSIGLFGHVGEFIAEHETFNAYVERMDIFFMANNIVETTEEGNTQAKGNIVRWILGRVVKKGVWTLNLFSENWT